MIIDVIDLNLKEINFNEPLEYERSKKAEYLYENKNVNIEKVEIEDDDPEVVNVYSKVNGSTGKYRNELSFFCDDGIVIDYYCSCEDYHKNEFPCKHIIATMLEILKPHNATTSDGMLRMFEEKKKKEKMQLENAKIEYENQIKLDEEREARQEYQRKYSRALDLLQMNTPLGGHESSSYFLERIYREREMPEATKTLDKDVEIEPTIVLVDGKYLSFKIGSNKKYVLKDVYALYTAYKNEEVLTFRKEFKLCRKEREFL